MQEVTVVGGGIAGLVAAISIAEGGGRVTLHEARGRLGGRAETTSGPHRANLGGHALYRHGDFEAWLCERDLLPATTAPRMTASSRPMRARASHLSVVTSTTTSVMVRVRAWRYASPTATCAKT